MLDCLIAGDSIAVGTGPHLRQCVTNAKVGISSAAIIPRVGNAKLLIVSAGSNDPNNPRLEDNLRAIRAKGNAREVVWILPANMNAALTVSKVARSYGDRTVSFTPGRDGIHPRSYRALAASIGEGR